MTDDPKSAYPPRLMSTEEAAAYIGTSRSALLADQKRVTDHPQSFRHPGRRIVVFDRLELEAYADRIKAEHRGEPLPPAPTTARQQFLHDQIAAWCSRQVLIPVDPGSIEAKSAAVREALKTKQDVTIVSVFQGEEILRTEYHWLSDGRCEATLHQAGPPRTGRLPKWAKAAYE